MSNIHVVDDYKNWQPTYAAYAKWPTETASDVRNRQVQAIREMADEAAEVNAIVTKSNRKGAPPLDRAKVLDELGDVFWGLCGVMNEFDIDWIEMISFNMNKLDARTNKESE